MTIPSVTRFDDFRFALYDLATGSMEVLAPDSIIDPQGETVPGVVGDRLRSCTFEVPWYSAPRTAINFDNLQMLAIGRYGASDQEHWEVGGSLTLWGLLLKPKEGYSKRVVGDSVQVQAVQVEELLRARKVFEYSAGAGKNLPLTFTNAKPDDIAKEMVRTCFSGVDIDGNPRDWEWGSLVVEADSSQCVDNIDIAILSGTEPTDTLWKRIDDLARTYDFDYQLVPTFVGGAWVFTFRTKAPYGGSDLTTGASRVQIKDLYNLVPSGTRYRDAAFRSTRMYTRGYGDSVEDAAAIASWGIWEGVATGPQLSAAEIALEKARVKEGAEYGFEATGANGMVTWVKDFKAGDLVNRANNRLSVAADSEKIAAVSWRFVDKVLQLTIRWGDREPAVTDRQGGGAYNPDEGDDGLIKGLLDDALLLAEFAPDGTLPVMGDGTYETYVDTATVGGVVVDALRIKGPWTRGDLGGVTGLRTSTAGDPVVIGANTSPNVASWIGTTKLEVIGDVAIDRYIYSLDGSMVAGGFADGYFKLHVGDAITPAGWLDVNTGGGVAIFRSVGDATVPSWFKADLHVYNGKTFAVLADLVDVTFQVAGATGNTTWKAAAQMSWEGVAYRMPTAVGTTGQVLTLTTGAPNQLSWTAPAPAAHAITGALHTVVGSQYQVVGLTAANTLGLLTPTVASAANSLVRTDASGYVIATRVGPTATEYIHSSAAGRLRAVAGTDIILWGGGGANVIQITSAGMYGPSTNTMELGNTTIRWSVVAGVLANFSGLATLGGNFAMAGNTSGYVPIADGTKFVAGAITKAMLPTHAHTYDKADSPTGSWTVGALISNTGNPIRDSGGTVQYVQATANSDGSGATWKIVYIGTSHHTHTITYTSTNSGTVII